MELSYQTLSKGSSTDASRAEATASMAIGLGSEDCTPRIAIRASREPHALNDFQRSTSASLSNCQGEYDGTSAYRYTVA
jgi:hypothetical protein